MVTVLSFVLLVLSCCHLDVVFSYVLEPDVELFNENLYNGEKREYELASVVPEKSYEIKISYPATIPTDFVIEIIKFGKSTRRLLNTEKAQFTANKNQIYIVAVTAHRTGVPLYNQDLLQKPAVYNIVLSTLYFGLPLEVWKMISIALVLILISIKYFMPWLLRYISTKCAEIQEKSI